MSEVKRLFAKMPAHERFFQPVVGKTAWSRAGFPGDVPDVPAGVQEEPI